MIDDFTSEYRGTQAPLDAVISKLDYLVGLNINAIEFMPWIAWPDDVGFSWGYNPAYFFSVESRYMADAGNPLNRLSRADLTSHIVATQRTNYALILEDSWGFDAVNDSNNIKPTGTWFDMLAESHRGTVGTRRSRI